MMAIGAFMLLGGGCFVACGFLLPAAQLPPEQAKNLQQLEQQFHGSFTVIFGIMGGIVALAGIYHIATGFFVRRGKRGAIFTAIVTSFLGIGWCVVNSLGGLVMGAPNAAAGVCFLFVAGAIFVWLILWLFQALKGSSGSAAAAAQYRAQYWQMLQQQQAYGQGIAVPPPPTGVMGPPPPPQPPSPEVSGWAYGQQTPPPPPPRGAQ